MNTRLHFLITFCVISFFTQNFILANSEPQAQKTLMEIAGLIEKHYYRIDEIKDQWPAMLEHAKKQIQETSIQRKQYMAIVELLEKFEHSHLNFTPPKSVPRSSKKRTLKKGVPKPKPKFPAPKVDDQLGLIKFKEELTIKKRDDGILYLAFNAFTFQQVGKIKQAISSNRDAKGMIIDLRNNGGGAGMLACGIALEFCEKDYSLGTMTGPDMNWSFPVVAQKEIYKGPLIILVNEASFSTSEILARGMQVAGEAIVVGAPTEGCALPSMIVELNDGSVFQYPVSDFKDANGDLLEATGVQPDHIVEISISDLRKGKDPQLAKAVELILKESP